VNGRFARPRCGRTPRVVLNALVARRVSNHFKIGVASRLSGGGGQPFSKPQEVLSVGTWRGGVCPRGSGVCSKRLAVSIRRLMARRFSPEGVAIGSRYSFRDGSASASGTLCLSTGGERVDTVRCVDCRRVAGAGETKEDPGTRSRLCCYCSCPRVCSIFEFCTGYTLSSTGSAENSPGWRQHTWAGDVLGRGPYQAITALNSLRYRLGRYPVVARRCLASY
jgi:hypothetical protein